MKLTTPPRPHSRDYGLPAVMFDFRELAPLVDYRRLAVRLHPRRGEPGAFDSSLGGPLVLARDESWPMCAGEHRAGTLTGENRSGIAEPMVCGLQLWRRDVAELPFRGDEVLCQILWCPLTHRDGPGIEIRWRSRDDDLVAVPAPPPSPYADADYLPSPCVLSPERILEYPGSGQLPLDWVERIRAWDAARGADYDWANGPAPGTKVGGWLWATDGLGQSPCPARHLMTPVVTIASAEFRLGQESWQPVEEQPWHDGPSVLGDGVRDAGLTLSDLGELYIYICELCPDRPYAWELHH